MSYRNAAPDRRRWLKRLMAMTLVPLAVFGLIESSLRIAGYGYDSHYFRRVRVQGSDFYVPSEKFSERFFPHGLARPSLPIRLAAEKPAHSYRIFLFGESAANGDPDPTYGFGRYLEILLNERFPGNHFQVACVAVTAIDSNVILPIAGECSRRQGDLWIFYMGNNEMVGPFGAETAFGLRAPSRWMIRTILAIKTTRTAQCLENLLRNLRVGSAAPKNWGGMQMFANSRIAYADPARLRAYRNFKGNLEDILNIAHRSGVPVILSTVAVNLKDCPPFASVHSPALGEKQTADWDQAYGQGIAFETNCVYDKALAAYRLADKIDPHYAELKFRMGCCESALTNYDQARRSFEMARDNDALDFRADSRVNAAITEAALRHSREGVCLLDAASLLARHSPGGIPGFNCFYEHVHLNFSGDYLLALGFAEAIKSQLPGPIAATDTGKWASAEECDRRLAITVWDRQRVWQPVFNRISAPPFTGRMDDGLYFKKCAALLDQAKQAMSLQSPEQARQMYEQALALAPEDNLLHGNFERFLEAAGDLTNAISEAERVCQLTPYLAGGHYYVGTLLMRAGRTAEAASYLQHSIQIRPDFAPAHLQLGTTLATQGKLDEARKEFKKVLRLDPTNSLAMDQLKMLELAIGRQ